MNDDGRGIAPWLMGSIGDIIETHYTALFAITGTLNYTVLVFSLYRLISIDIGKLSNIGNGYFLYFIIIIIYRYDYSSSSNSSSDGGGGGSISRNSQSRVVSTFPACCSSRTSKSIDFNLNRSGRRRRLFIACRLSTPGSTDGSRRRRNNLLICRRSIKLH